MQPTASNSPKLAGLYCRASWHLRKNPRAAVLHDLALQLTNGGETEFHLSRRQVAQYFGWGLSSAADAFNECEREGFFIRTSTGKGGRFGQPDFANTYQTRTHKQVAEEGKYPCLTCAVIDTGSTRTVIDTGVCGNGNGGVRPQIQDPCGNGNLVYDLKSTKESGERVSEPKPTPSLSFDSKSKPSDNEELKGLVNQLTCISDGVSLFGGKERQILSEQLKTYSAGAIKQLWQEFWSEASTGQQSWRTGASARFCKVLSALLDQMQVGDVSELDSVPELDLATIPEANYV